jgi:hypothetical protein
MAKPLLVATTSSVVIKQPLIVACWYNLLLELPFNTLLVEMPSYSTTKITTNTSSWVVKQLLYLVASAVLEAAKGLSLSCVTPLSWSLQDIVGLL